MKAKEKMALMSLLSSVITASSELKYYGKDYNSTAIFNIGETLEKAVSKFRKDSKV